ncbi:MAG: hypothetical protein LBH29_03695 [Elusimicrobiota bacterium]|nr:hypothetical protein [Elusimicrobiota bacterium]
MTPSARIAAALCVCARRNDTRVGDCDSATGAGFSAHKYGRALDLHICNIENKKLDKPAKTGEYEKLRSSLLSNTAFNILNFETNIYWLHIDTFNRQNRIFKP